MKKKYGKLLEPAKIGKMELRNRVTLAPMDFKYVYGNYKDSTFTQRLADVYKERAKGGAGLIFSSCVKTEQKLDAFPKNLDFPILDRDERIKEFANVADAIHLYGGKMAVELTAGGGRLADLIEDDEPVSASRVITQYNPDIYTRPLTIEEIHYLIDAYGEAAGRVKAAGIDAIDVMSSGGYMIAQFLSPVWNQREDEYGGSPEKRMRFLIECIESVKAHCGEDFPIIVNLCIDEKLANIKLGVLTTGEKLDESKIPRFSSNGITTEYAVQVAQELERRNLVDAYQVRIGNYYNQEHIIPSAYSTNEEYRTAMRQFKQGVTKPVIFENKLNGPEKMGKMIEDGITDFVSMGRGWLAEPHWVVKAEKDSAEIRPCIRCMMCLDTLWNGKYCQCAVNPQLGHEAEKLLPALEKKKVVVIGGGPGGMEAAVTAAKRGHDVTLLERSGQLGGRLYEAGAVSYKSEVLDYAGWAVRQIEKSKVKVQLNTEATKKSVLGLKPDSVIIATGADAIRPRIPGAEKAEIAENVILSDNLDFNTAVIIGGGMIGCETAYKLWEQGKKVTVVELQPDILMETSLVYRHAAVEKIVGTGIEILTDSQVIEINENGVKLSDGQQIEGEKVILAVGLRSRAALYRELYDDVEEVYLVGDSKKVGKVFHAVNEAYRIAADL